MFPPFMESADVLSIPPLSRMSSDSVKKFESITINLSERICEGAVCRPKTLQIDSAKRLRAPGLFGGRP